MNLKNQIIAIIAISTATFFTACKKNTVSGNGSIKLEFENLANGNALNYNTDYTNDKGETMRFSKFKYYISNISFAKADGSIYTVPKDQSYFLVDQDVVSSQTITIPNVPAGDYNKVNFMIGVDSAKSTVSLVERTGVLDPVTGGADMYWDWNSGYIFVKAEGSCPQIPADTNNPNKLFFYHIGMFGGMTGATPNNIKRVSLQEADKETATVRTNITPRFHLNVNIMEMFKTPTSVSIAQNNFVMVDEFSGTVANNYLDMFVIDHIHNN
jgi:hypothetical protein